MVHQDLVNLLETSRLYRNQLHLDKAVLILQKVRESALMASCWREYFEGSSGLIWTYCVKSEFTKADQVYAEVLSAAKANGLEVPYGVYYAMGAGALFRQDAHAMKFHVDMCEKRATEVQSEHGLGLAAFARASMLEMMDHTDEALKQAAEVEKSGRTAKGHRFWSILLQANSLQKMKHFDLAEKKLLEVQDCDKSVGNQAHIIASTLFSYANLFYETNELKLSQHNITLMRSMFDMKSLSYIDQKATRLLGQIELKKNGSLDLFDGERAVSIPGREKINFGNRQILWKTLRFLAENRNREVGKEEMVSYLWKEDYNPLVHDNKIYVNINRLRKLIEIEKNNPKIILKDGESYRLSGEFQVNIG